MLTVSLKQSAGTHPSTIGWRGKIWRGKLINLVRQKKSKSFYKNNKNNFSDFWCKRDRGDTRRERERDRENLKEEDNWRLSQAISDLSGLRSMGLTLSDFQNRENKAIRRAVKLMGKKISDDRLEQFSLRHTKTEGKKQKVILHCSEPVLIGESLIRYWNRRPV